MTRMGRRLWLRSRELAVPRQPPGERRPPRLRVYRAQPHWWYWQLDHGDGTGRGGSVPTHAGALAVGLAYLAEHTAAWARHEHGEPSRAWEKIQT